MNPTFLIDTNIIIQFEDSGLQREIKPLFSRLHELLIRYSLKHYYHPSSEKDFSSDKDDSRKMESLSRLKKYPALTNPPTASLENLERLFGKITRSNDHIDCEILFALQKSCVHFVISEDKGLRSRARNAGLEPQVLNVHEAIDLLERSYEEKIPEHPRLETEYCYNIDLVDPIFDSLTRDYSFKEWFLKTCCPQQRKCWTIRSNDRLAGICIFKVDETWKDLPGPGLKLCTFKVSEEFEGKKYGELLLRVAMLYAVKNGLNTIWLTAHSKQEKLGYFLQNFGFRIHPDKKGDELVIYKEMIVPSELARMNPLDFHVRYFPNYYDDETVKKYLIPIKPTFYKILFPENEIDSQTQLGLMSESATTPGNTIRKVYLSHSNISKLDAGSLIFFYVSTPHSAITTLGIVESTQRLSNPEAVGVAIGKRSVYSQKEIVDMAKKETLVINFRTIRHFERIELAELKNVGFITAPPQTISSFNHQQYLKIKPFIKFND